MPPAARPTRSAGSRPDQRGGRRAVHRVVTLLGITLLSVAPALLLMMTSFTKIFVVLAMTRNALGAAVASRRTRCWPGWPCSCPCSSWARCITDMNTIGDPALPERHAGLHRARSAAASAPLQHFMLAHTREEDIALMTRAAGPGEPRQRAAVPLPTLIPAFMISELRAAFIIGFVIFVPFLVIDLVVSAALMSMGMMMLPPVMISLPFKILLFILVDGWGLIITSLITSYQVA